MAAQSNLVEGLIEGLIGDEPINDGLTSALIVEQHYSTRELFQ